MFKLIVTLKEWQSLCCTVAHQRKVKLYWLFSCLIINVELTSYCRETQVGLTVHQFLRFPQVKSRTPDLLVAQQLSVLLYVFGAGLAVVESQACYPPLSNLFH